MSDDCGTAPLSPAHARLRAPAQCVLLAIVRGDIASSAFYAMLVGGRVQAQGVADVPGDVARVVRGALVFAEIAALPAVLAMRIPAERSDHEPPCSSWARAWSAYGGHRRGTLLVPMERLEGEIIRLPAPEAFSPFARALIFGRWAAGSSEVRRAAAAQEIGR